MALENILQSIEERRDSELKRIADEYNAKVEAAVSETQARLRTLQNEFERKTAEDSRSLENRELSNADIEAKKALRDKRSQLVDAGLSKAYEIMDNLSNSPEYKDVVLQMVTTARKLLGSDCTIRVGVVWYTRRCNRHLTITACLFACLIKNLSRIKHAPRS